VQAGLFPQRVPANPSLVKNLIPTGFLGGIVRRLFFAAGIIGILSTATSAQTGGANRIDCGGVAITDAAAQNWSADFGYNSGNVVTNTANIAGTSNQALFHTARMAASKTTPLIYSLPVTSGSYHVNLYFAETSPRTQSVGARVFNVKVGGTMAFQNLDIFAAVGGYTALVKGIDTVVTDGQLTIELDSVTRLAEISGIEVTQTLATPQMSLNFRYPDGTPVGGQLNYTVTTSASTMKGTQPLTNGQATCLLVSSPQVLGLIGTMNVGLSLTDTAGNTLWQVALTMNPGAANFASVQSSALYVTIQKP
jgi:hypothetical protein